MGQVSPQSSLLYSATEAHDQVSQREVTTDVQKLATTLCV